MRVERFSNRAQRRAAIAAMRAQASEFAVGQLVELPRHEWPREIDFPPNLLRVFRDREFLVQEFRDENGWLRLSINIAAIGDGDRWVDGISWDELQRLKNQCGYEHACAVELFPPARKVVNVANIRHLWILPSPPPYMWGAATVKSA